MDVSKATFTVIYTLILIFYILLVNKVIYKWLYVLVILRTLFRVNLQSIVARMSRNSLLKAGAESEGESKEEGVP